MKTDRGPGRGLRVLLSDGTGLTGRQVATLLGRRGHVVEVLNPVGRALTRKTKWVREVHDMPAFGDDPYGWLDAAAGVLADGDFDVLIPTQEQVTVLAQQAGRLRSLGVGIAVPTFAALTRVQDKLSAAALLDEVGLPQPPSIVARTPGELVDNAMVPCFVKTPIGTASTGVHHAVDRHGLAAIAETLTEHGGFDHGGVLVQQPASGPLMMVQAVFQHGTLVSWHANLRVREGAGGGAASKRSVRPPQVAEHLAVLGRRLAWHGAIALDAILTTDGPSYIDINPRLVEPYNAWLAGTDFVGALLDISLGQPATADQTPREDVTTHQLLLGVLGAAAGGRVAVLKEVATALCRRGPYRGSVEELTPPRGDLRSTAFVASIVAILLVNPALARGMAGGAVSNYALTAQGWQAIRAREQDGFRDAATDPAVAR